MPAFEPSQGIATPWVSRFYQTERDLLQMQDMLMQARAQSGDWHYKHVGELLWDFFMVVCHLDPTRHIRLWHVGDDLVGYAVLGEDPSIDFQVLPEYEWRGIEAEAMAWAKTKVAGLRIGDPQSWRGNFVSGYRQDNEKRRAFFEGEGFHPGGEFSEVNMIRPLREPLPEVAIPAGCQVRSMGGVDEIPDRAEIQREVWMPWTVGHVSDEDYARFMQLPGYSRDLDVVAVASDGVIAAYVNGWIDPLNRIGDLGPLGARPAYRRQGLTRAAIIKCLYRMRALGMDRACVSTGISNTPAIRLYESISFVPVNQYIEFVKAG